MTHTTSGPSERGSDSAVDEHVDEITAAALRARRGDELAAAAFVRATQADVWRLCVNLGSPDSAEDLAQETYSRAFAGLHRFGGRSSARTWLLAIARRVCADAVRAAVRHRAAHARAAAQIELLSADPADASTVRGLLDGLERDRREAFVLTQLVGLSYAEAAEVCGCALGTIRSRVARARADLVDGWRGGTSGSGSAGRAVGG